MKDEKILNISDSEIEKISGGVVPGAVYRNSSTYSSGDRPMYKKGDIVTLDFIEPLGGETTCQGKILDVSADKCCGTFFKEFGYKIKILSISTDDTGTRSMFKGMIYENVYESCIKRA